jgi:hypothetical protein
MGSNRVLVMSSAKRWTLSSHGSRTTRLPTPIGIGVPAALDCDDSRMSFGIECSRVSSWSWRVCTASAIPA